MTMIALYVVLGLLLLIFILALIGSIFSKRYEITFDNHYVPHKNNDYPDCEQGNFISQKKVHNFTYDKNFHYRYGQTFKEKVVVGFCTFLFLTIIPLLIIFDGAGIYKSRRKFKSLRKQFKDGFITVCNHCYVFDCLMIKTLAYGRKMYFPIWKEGAEGPSGTLYRASGGMPMDHSFEGMKNCFNEMIQVLKEGHHLHVFPEQAGWFYYGGIREFKDGVFRIAYATNKPIIPLAINFRERKGIWRLFGSKKKPLVCLHVGDPIIPDITKDKKEEVNRLLVTSREAVMHLAGIKDEETNNAIKASYNYYKYDPSKSAY